MTQDQIRYFLALSREQDWGKAAKACDVPEQEFQKTLRTAEYEYGVELLKPGIRFTGFTEEGQKVLLQARDLSCALEALEQCFSYGRRKNAVASLLDRRSISPKRLCAPAPDNEAIELMTAAALSAPDHGGLHPWRIIVFPQEQRERLADIFEREKLRRDPLASPSDLHRAREHAIRSPALLAFVISPKARVRVPEREQLLAAGAALGNFMNAVHQLGYAGILLSGERTFDPVFCADLGVGTTEYLACFICLGSISSAPPSRANIQPSAQLTTWAPSDVLVNSPKLPA